MTYNFDYYSGKDLMYPSLIKKPRLPANATPTQHREYADQLEEYEVDKADRGARMKEYNATVNDRLEQFKNELMSDYDLSRAQFDVLWDYAWGRGHSAGLSEVYHYFDEFYDMATEFSRLEK